MYEYTPKDIQRFWKYVINNGPNKCWGWIGARHTFGYGMLGLGGRKGRPRVCHRISWELHFGEIPAEMSVLHKCDNPICCNPNHLFVGTQKDNIADMIQKGRRKQGNAYGEKSPFSKLTDQKVMEIRERFAGGGITQTELAREYGVHSTMIGFIVRRVKWKHLP